MTDYCEASAADPNGNKSAENPNAKKQKKDEKKRLKAEKFEKKKANVSFKNVNGDGSVKPVTSPAEKIEYTGNTEKGKKKDTKCPLPDKYSPAYVEASWYSWWENQGFFKPEYRHSVEEISKMPQDRKFVVLIPPPNVTGTLHIGHALMCSIEDVLVRWNRMKGKVVIWNPGCDHAGIATQVVVEKKIKRELGLNRRDVGREKFLSLVWDWKNEKGVVIYHQMRRLGISVDWSRDYFTMDETRCEAVIEAFARLYEENLIYRAKKLINWSCTLRSAISDIEVEKLEINGRTLVKVPGYEDKVEFGQLIVFSYCVVGSSEKISVATTRVETMLGDVAVAVSPNDERYAHMVGKKLHHPFCNREMVVIADYSVDQAFGTGAVKITPAHDPTDYDIGTRHSLQMINIFTEDGCVVDNLCLRDEYKFFSGMRRFDARKRVVEEIRKLHLFVEVVDHSYVVPVCSRSKDIVEPLLKPQWFLSCSEMGKKACEAVRSGELKITPSLYEKIWFHWMENINDWCISRQLWWGHRIPAYFVSSKDGSFPNADTDDPKYWVCARSEADAVEVAARKFGVPSSSVSVARDDDVLDTWFSSGLLPFSVFGWPEKTDDYDNFFPTSLLETGYDILFFWVARMVMLSQKLTGLLPFKEVLLHPIIKDSHGRKMSKSLGNIIDPVDVIQGISLNGLHESLKSYNLDSAELSKAREGQKKDFAQGIPECGSDALRFTLCSYSGSPKDINLDVLRVQGYKFFCNKIWNAVKFSLRNLGDEFTPSLCETRGHRSMMDKWILSRLACATAVTNEALGNYDFSAATSSVHGFWLYDLCDVYIEYAKSVFSDQSCAGKVDLTRNVLFCCVDNGLRLLHPFMPFITEELFQRLPFGSDHFDTTPSICVSVYPEELPWWDAPLEGEVEIVMSTVRAIRSIKSDYMASKEKVDVSIRSYDQRTNCLLQENETLIKALCCASTITYFTSASTSFDIPPGCVTNTNGDICDVHLMLRGAINVDKEIEKTQTKLNKAKESLANLVEVASVPGYFNKVPLPVRTDNSDKQSQLTCEIDRLEKIITSLKLVEKQ